MFLIQMIQVKIVLRIPHGRLQMEDFTQILLAEEDPIMTNLSPHPGELEGYPLQPLMEPYPHPLPLLLINHFGLNQGGESRKGFRQSVSAKKWLLWQQ